MSPDDDRSRLLPGLSAAAWYPMWIGLQVACPILFLAGLVIASPTNGRGSAGVLGISMVVVAVVFLLLIRIARTSGLPRERAEVRAGYTTLSRKYQQLDQLDPHTGVVLRRAHSPFVSVNNDHEHPVAFDSTARKRPGPANQIVPFLAGLALCAVLVVVDLATGGSGNGTLVRVGAIGGAVGLLLFVVYVYALVGRRRGLRRAHEFAGGDLEFTFQPNVGLVKLAAKSAPANSDGGRPSGYYISAAARGMMLLAGSPLSVRSVIPWKSVAKIEASSAQLKSVNVPMLVVTYVDAGQQHHALQFASPTALPGAWRSTPGEVAWIAARLNELRTGSNITRVI